MSIPLIACSRRGASPLSSDDLDRLVTRLRPDGVPPSNTDLWWHTADGVITAVFFPGRWVPTHGTALALGGSDGDLLSCSTAVPDNAAGVFRADADANVLTVSSDAVASRTLWYAHTPEIFVSSTSQRAITAVLRSFEPDDRALSWVLTTGKLGPRQGWDARVTHLPPDATLRLDRARWTLRLTSREGPWQCPDPPRTLDDHVHRLRAALDETVAGMDLRDDVVVPISGGYDSRAILVWLCRHKRAGTRLRALTWGRAEALADPLSDASVAKDLCRALGVEHRYHVLTPCQDFAKVFERFVSAGEGRIDHLGGYLDGFDLWASLRAEGVTAIVRGDMVFGYPSAQSALDVRLDTGIPLVNDLVNLRTIESLVRRGVVWPDDMLQRAGETPTAWNNRLGHTYRLPTALAALTHLKTSYVEVLNPLLSRPVVACARELSLSQYVYKSVWKEFVRRTGPAVPFARSTATTPAGEFLARPEVRAYLLGVLQGQRPEDVLPGDVLAFARAAVAPRRSPPSPSLATRCIRALGGVRHLVPARARGPLRAMFNTTVNPSQVALRAALYSATRAMFIADARILDTPSTNPVTPRA